MPSYEAVAKWLNGNQGVLVLSIFFATLAIGWCSGIFGALRRRPQLKFDLLPGPTFCCTYPTGAVYNALPVHRTGIALYLRISNVGSAATSVENISVGYHGNIQPASLQWLRYRVGWLSLNDQTAAIHDFQSKIGENIKIYPFLVQASILSGRTGDTFLVPGQSTNGVVYFEQSDSWGGFFPVVDESGVRVRVTIRDTFGARHVRKFTIPALSMEQARHYNPSFGKTLAELRGETLPHDTGA